jgi:hypothetical protein
LVAIAAFLAAPGKAVLDARIDELIRAAEADVEKSPK